MKTLLLLRHAKSSWKEFSRAQVAASAPLDHDRPLNQRGQADAPRMGALLHSLGEMPELVLGSSARRVWQTLELFLPALGYAGDVVLTRGLYLSGAPAYLNELVRVASQLRVSAEPKPREARVLLLVGHNPDLEELLSHLTGADEPMPTGALAVLRSDLGTWAECASGGTARLDRVYRPRELEVLLDKLAPRA